MYIVYSRKSVTLIIVSFAVLNVFIKLQTKSTKVLLSYFFLFSKFEVRLLKLLAFSFMNLYKYNIGLKRFFRIRMKEKYFHFLANRNI